MTKDDVSLALHHVDEGHRTTDIYIDKDWGIIDEVQAGVIGLLHDLDEPKVANMSHAETRKSMFIISA